jgi:hypothetical protein
VAYADDAYVMVKGKDLDELKSNTQLIMDKHISWLESIGMVVNVGKTEAVLFGRHKSVVDLEVKGTIFSTKPSMNILGVTFDSQLRRKAITVVNWY